MNLSGDPWIPVVNEEGEKSLVSLDDVFRKGGRIRDLAVSPAQRIALTRLLVCITQAALDGPQDEEDWLACKDRIAPAALEYLQRRRDCFELYGDKPFLQIAGLEADKDATTDKLDQRLSSGNNPILFDHDAQPGGRLFTDAEIALNLLTFQNFNTGGKVGQSIWQNQKISDSTFAAPCLKYAHTLIRGRNLIETIFFNLLCKADLDKIPNSRWGRPVWEDMPTTIGSQSAFDNICHSYLGRLTPLSRLIRLYGNNSQKPTACIIGPLPKPYRLNHLPDYREPSASVIRTRTDKLMYLMLNPGKHIWRDLASVLSLSKAQESGAIPLANCLKYKRKLADKTVDIWIGGLATGSSEAKIEDEMEWNFSIGLDILGQENIGTYQKGCELANLGEWSLTNAVKQYFKTGFNVASAPTTQTKSIYWSILDSKYHILINTCCETEKRLDGEWYATIRAAMEESYDAVCPRVSPRQIQAYSLGRQQLRLKKPN